MHFQNLNKDEKIDYYLKSIDEIKAVVAGRDTSLLEYAFNGLRYSEKKTDEFLNKLIDYICLRYKNYDMVFDIEKSKFYTAFFKLCIIYCAMEVRKSDLVFESFLKLSKTLEKQENGESTLDVMVQTVKSKDKMSISSEEDLNILLHNYNIICNLYNNCYDEYFVSNIRYSVNEFLDEENLSFFVDDKSFASTINILTQCKRKLKEIKFRKVAEAEKDATDE